MCGERGQVVKAEVCGTSIRGFKSRRSPYKLSVYIILESSIVKVAPTALAA